MFEKISPGATTINALPIRNAPTIVLICTAETVSHARATYLGSGKSLFDQWYAPGTSPPGLFGSDAREKRFARPPTARSGFVTGWLIVTNFDPTSFVVSTVPPCATSA